ncbi:FixH family protein [Streptomyces stramineus]
MATGLYQSWRQVGSWGALTGTEYGRLLLIKAGLVVVLVGLAYFSRRWTGRLADRTEPRKAKAPAVKAARSGKSDGVTAERAAQLARQQAALTKAAGKRKRDGDENRSGLRRSVLAETAVAVVVLAVTTLLTGTQPGRAETEQKQAAGAAGATAPAATGPAELTIDYDTGGTNGRGTAAVRIDPARSGDNTLGVSLTDPAGKPVDVPELEVSFTETRKKIGPLRASLKRLDTGRWEARGFQLPMGGEWQLTLTVRTSDIDQVTEIENVKIN